MPKPKIDFCELMGIRDESDRLQACFELARNNPEFKWDKVSENAPLKVKQAHAQLWGFLNRQRPFTDFLAKRSRSYIERWQERGASTSITSDHMPVGNHVSLHHAHDHSKPPVSLRILTWNLMNKAHSVASCRDQRALAAGKPYANTPEQDLDETLDQYLERKYTQIDQIMAHLTEPNNRTDAMFLQEIDFLKDPHPNDRDKQKKFDLKNFFEARLRDAGFALVMTDDRMNAKPQAIIYNAHTLQLDGSTPLTPLMPGTHVGGQDPRNTLFEAQMQHRSTGQKVILASAHLDFEGNYSTSLRARSAEKAAEGAMYIWGGDTNHTPGHQIQGLTGDYTQATNYDAREGGFTSHHTGTYKAKAYDGIGFCPPPGCFIQSVEEGGDRFHVDRASGRLSVQSFPRSTYPHHSLVGFPWMSRQSMVLEVLGYKQKIIDQFIQDTHQYRGSEWQIKILNKLKQAQTISHIESVLQGIETRAHQYLDEAKALKNDDAALTHALSGSPVPSDRTVSCAAGQFDGNELLNKLENLGAVLSAPDISGNVGYKINDHSGQLLFDGKLNQQGHGSVQALGEWNPQKARNIAQHIISDLGWRQFDLSTAEPHGIPREYISTVVQYMNERSQEPHALRITVDGQLVEQYPSEDYKERYREITRAPSSRGHPGDDKHELNRSHPLNKRS
jgi:hypothetical protein